jgi:hypothetical protein
VTHFTFFMRGRPRTLRHKAWISCSRPAFAASREEAVKPRTGVLKGA